LRAELSSIKARRSGADTHKMKGVLACAVIVVALMVVIKDGRVTRKLGLAGSCVSVATPKGQTGAWVKCTSGKLQGAPNLSRQSCTSVQAQGKIEYWRCPVAIQAGPHG
jgi:hypothetical protein